MNRNILKKKKGKISEEKDKKLNQENKVSEHLGTIQTYCALQVVSIHLHIHMYLSVSGR